MDISTCHLSITVWRSTPAASECSALKPLKVIDAVLFWCAARRLDRGDRSLLAKAAPSLDAEQDAA
jgi:hypothetical protein